MKGLKPSSRYDKEGCCWVVLSGREEEGWREDKYGLRETLACGTCANQE